MKRIYALVLVAFLAILSGCAASEINHNIDRFAQATGLAPANLALQEAVRYRGFIEEANRRAAQQEADWRSAQYSFGIELGEKECQTGRRMCGQCQSSVCFDICAQVVGNRRRQAAEQSIGNAYEQGRFEAQRMFSPPR